MNDVKKFFKAFIETLLVSMAIMAVRYSADWKQYGMLQMDRKSDDAVYMLYFFAFFSMLYALYRLEGIMKEKILKMIEERIEENKQQQQFFEELDDNITARQYYFMAREAEEIYDLLEAELKD